uniref:Cytochrome c oxidase subunit 3 n=1 Tax=Colossendeis brevirostris TaxID=619823 RepID=A0A9E7V4R1_9CHEL|nr:cytochrome c oxidase subunit 3 [Colossendeis brevirostris]UYX57807.1 cytochrome c oxidase subunit 3 [Colossendeis brevirostris]
MIKQYHPFHLVNQSPWPLTGAIGGMIMLVGLIELIYSNSILMMMMGIIILTLTMYQWWRDVIREATFQGHHTSNVNEGMRLGMILFIVSEIMFFFSFFWTFFHSSLSPSIEIGMMWPPLNIKMFNPLSIPLLNTLILISSGVTVTWSHHSIINNNFKNAKNALLMTVILGMYFSILQGWEYFEAPFSFSDSCFGSTFFMATGFHGLHVIIGSVFLLISLSRLSNFHYNLMNHFGFEAAAWYWHFVDVVWLFLYISIYWWGK